MSTPTPLADPQPTPLADPQPTPLAGPQPLPIAGPPPVVCVIGVFDGLHRGHQYLLAAAEAEAQQLGLPCLVVTFDRDPDEFFLPASECHKLLSNQERLELLSGQGQRQLWALSFDAELAAISPRDFLEQTLSSVFRPVSIHVGANFHFGAKAAGDVALLKAWGAETGCRIDDHRLLDEGGQAVSARRIRACLQTSQLAQANYLLTRPHHLRGPVVRGRGVGTQLGFPTANVAGSDGVMLPADGVYAGRAELIGTAAVFPAAISVGVPLTFQRDQAQLAATLEATLLDFQGDLYGSELKLEFLEYLRPMQSFADTESLHNQIAEDVRRTRAAAS